MNKLKVDTLNPGLGANPDLNVAIDSDNELKEFIVNYVGEKTSADDENVTVENIVEVMANDFPEFLGAVAEENWIRGYHQALIDVEVGVAVQEEERAEGENDK